MTVENYHREHGPVTIPATGNTELITYDVLGLTRLTVEISVSTQNLDAFIVEVRTHPSGSFNVIGNSSIDYVSPIGLIVGAETYSAANARLTGDLTAIVAGGRGLLVVDVTGLDRVRLSASAAVDSASVTTRASVD